MEALDDALQHQARVRDKLLQLPTRRSQLLHQLEVGKKEKLKELDREKTTFELENKKKVGQYKSNKKELREHFLRLATQLSEKDKASFREIEHTYKQIQEKRNRIHHWHQQETGKLN